MSVHNILTKEGKKNYCEIDISLQQIKKIHHIQKLQKNISKIFHVILATVTYKDWIYKHGSIQTAFTESEELWWKRPLEAIYIQASA